MKNHHLKTFWTALSMGLLLTVLTPVETFAQKRNDPPKKEIKKSNSHSPSPAQSYKKLPHRGAQVSALPAKTVQIHHGHYDYHLRNGIFYRPIGGTYVVVAPPIGIRVASLPPSPYQFVHAGRPYYYYYGAFYLPLSNGGYEVVSPPFGAKVDALPDGYEVFELDGKVYYRLDDIYYKAVIEPNGAVAYEVVRY